MKVLLLHQYFRTPSQGGGIRSYHVAMAMSKAGHEVVVITTDASRSYTENLGTVVVHYLHVPYANHFPFARRIWSFMVFYYKALAKSKSILSVDVVYAISTPLSVGWLGKQISARNKARFVFEVGDLWPEVPIQMGIIKNGLLKRWLYRVEKLIYREAETVIALSSGMVPYLESHGANKVLVVPNMCDLGFFTYQMSQPPTDRRFTIGYFGTIGLANHLEYLIELAELSRQEQLEIDYMIVGDGARKAAIQKMILAKGLSNIKVLPWQDMAGVRELMEQCAAIYVSFQRISILHTGSPNKLFDGLAAGKMIISNLSGWSKHLIDTNHVGLTYDPTDPIILMKELKLYLNDRSRLDEIQKNAFHLAQSFDKDKLTESILKALD